MSPAGAKPLQEELDDLVFFIEKSLRYHQRRKGFFEACHRWLMFLIIMLGAVSAANVFGSSVAFALSSAAIAAVDLVFSLGPRARDHLLLHRRFSVLMAEILRTLSLDPTVLAEWQARRVEIVAEEPPIYWALDRDCYNEVHLARGERDGLFKLSWAERLFMHFWRFEQIAS